MPRVRRWQPGRSPILCGLWQGTGQSSGSTATAAPRATKLATAGRDTSGSGLLGAGGCPGAWNRVAADGEAGRTRRVWPVWRCEFGRDEFLSVLRSPPASGGRGFPRATARHTGWTRESSCFTCGPVRLGRDGQPAGTGGSAPSRPSVRSTPTKAAPAAQRSKVASRGGRDCGTRTTVARPGPRTAPGLRPPVRRPVLLGPNRCSVRKRCAKRDGQLSGTRARRATERSSHRHRARWSSRTTACTGRRANGHRSRRRSL